MEQMGKLMTGLRNRSRWTLVGNVFSALGVFLTLIIGWNEFESDKKVTGIAALVITISFALLVSISRSWRPTRVEFRLPNSDTIIEITFGDIFVSEGIRVIGVNEFFDTEVGRPVSEYSLHGMFILNSFGGGRGTLDDQINKELEKAIGVETNKMDGKSKRFPIGATTLIKVNSDQYMLLAITKTDLQTCKASSDVGTIWTALGELWERARHELSGKTLNLPLLGSGLAGVGIPTRDLLNLIILSAIDATKKTKVAGHIRIVLHESKFDDLDLRDVKNYWKT